MFDKELIKSWIVLLVDDEPDNLEVARKVFSFYQATVHTATDGIECLELLASIEPTFILLDISMPRKDGWETIDAIRNTPQTKEIPVIALTAHAMEGDKKRAMTSGFDGYITKPFRLNTFFNDISSVLNNIDRFNKK